MVERSDEPSGCLVLRRGPYSCRLADATQHPAGRALAQRADHCVGARPKGNRRGAKAHTLSSCRAAAQHAPSPRSLVGRLGGDRPDPRCVVALCRGQKQSAHDGPCVPRRSDHDHRAGSTHLHRPPFRHRCADSAHRRDRRPAIGARGCGLVRCAVAPPGCDCGKLHASSWCGSKSYGKDEGVTWRLPEGFETRGRQPHAPHASRLPPTGRRHLDEAAPARTSWPKEPCTMDPNEPQRETERGLIALVMAVSPSRSRASMACTDRCAGLAALH